MANETVLYFNGIDGVTGDYALPPMTPGQLASALKGEAPDELLGELKLKTQAPFPIEEGKDPDDLAQSGWGLIMAHTADPAAQREQAAILEALSELRNHRKQQAGARYHEYLGADGYRPGETKNQFISRHGLGPGPVKTDVMPYYLLIVGDPDVIPYRFQNQLDVQFAVGRIWFDSLEQYAQYARSVVETETGKVALARQAAFFGVNTPGDPATKLSAEEMVAPLSKTLTGEQASWQIKTHLAGEANKAQLAQLLGGSDTPALVYTASHGMAFPNGDARQLPHQGALLCQDWPGPGAHKGPISPDWYFSADDVGSDARLLGSMAFFFACFGAGTPRLDDFARQAGLKQRAELAPRSFTAALPQKLLSHPKGGMLAVVGHVERAWGYSFLWERAGAQLAVFRDTLTRLMNGSPVGYALEPFNGRYAEIASDLAGVLDDLQYNAKVDELALAGLWTANNDARNYVVLGDPAARLPVVPAGKKGKAKARPQIKPIDVSALKSGLKVEASEPAQPATSATQATQPVIEPDQMPPKTASFDAVAFALNEERVGLGESLKRFTGELAAALGRAADDISSLEVSTYTSSDLSAVKYDYATRKLTGQVTLRALTRIAFDGDMQVCVPERSDANSGRGIDRDLWDIHKDMVKEAQANRAEFLRAMAEMATRLIDILKV